MAEQATADTAPSGLAIEAQSAKGSSGRKRFYVVFSLLLLLAGSGAVAYFAGAGSPFLAGFRSLIADEAPVVDERIAVFYEVPEILVNLNSSGANPSYLKIVVALELDDEAHLRELKSLLPRIIDSFQVYLRELRVEDLQGSAGMQRLREELLTRVNASLQVVRVRDVLFKEMLVQ